MCDFLFAPTGVSAYYLRIMKALDQHLGAPKNLAVSDGGAGGNLLAGTYYVKVTALDNVGGETTASNTSSVTIAGNHKIAMVWNVVPNAVKYNIYVSTDNVSFRVLAGTTTPVSGPQPITATVSYTWDGFTDSTVNTLVASTISYNDGLAVFTSGTLLPWDILPPIGIDFVLTLSTNPNFNGTWKVLATASSTAIVCSPQSGQVLASGDTSTGGTMTFPTSTPGADTTQQTALYVMPGGSVVTYDNTDIVAFYPADLPISIGGTDAGGGTGGGGTTTSGTPGQQGSTPSGGIAGNVSFIPQIVQFTNQAAIALGNSYPPHVYSDATGTAIHPATVANISAMSVDANGVVTVTTATAHGMTSSHVGGSVIIAGSTPTVYRGTFVVITVADSTHFTVRNLAAIGSGASSNGTVTTTSLPIVSNFTPAFPTWIASVAWAVNSVVTPTVSNGHYYVAVQGGSSGSVAPTFPTGTGNRVADGSVIWQEAGLINTAAPPPPGAAHIAVYAGSLWVWDTSTTNTATGLDGPCSLRMSDVNNLNSWNPINQAFLDKDDGTEGMGLASFTITAQGIPPQGSLVAFKLYATYQILGVFGSSNFAIQRVTTDMGCLAPRTLQFIPGFGLGRIAHLGVAVFDGVNDRVISEQIRPYLFPSNDPDLSDIVVADANWLPLSWGCQTANPPMYCVFIPVGTSNGELTEALCFDLVLKNWSVVNLPFPIGTACQVRPVTSNPVTLLGSYSDGTLQRWQAGDVLWATASAGSGTTAKVSWSVRIPTTASKAPDERLFCRRIVIRGQVGDLPGSTININPRIAGVPLGSAARPIPASGDFQIQTAVNRTHDRFDAIVSGSGAVTIDAFDIQVVAKPIGVLAGWVG